MKHPIIRSLLCGALLAAGPGITRAAETTTTPSGKPMGREEAVLVTVTASVEAIDHATREVTLKGPLGNTVTFTADPRVKRLNEVKVGDLVRAEYFVSIAAELRPPTEAEAKTPLVMLDAAGRAPPGTSPAGGGLRRFKAVATIEGLDRPTQSVTLKGPGGNYLTARVADPSRLTQARIGDTVIVTYTEALAVSLDKVSKPTTD